MPPIECNTLVLIECSFDILGKVRKQVDTINIVKCNVDFSLLKNVSVRKMKIKMFEQMQWVTDECKQIKEIELECETSNCFYDFEKITNSFFSLSVP